MARLGPSGLDDAAQLGLLKSRADNVNARAARVLGVLEPAVGQLEGR